jgi:hypothetical protein
VVIRVPVWEVTILRIHDCSRSTVKQGIRDESVLNR